MGRGWGGGGRCGCGDERQPIYSVRRVVRVQEPCLELWASDEVPWIPREARRVSAGAACESSRSISVCWPRMRVCTSRARANKGAGQFLDPGNGSQTQGARGDILLLMSPRAPAVCDPLSGFEIEPGFWSSFSFLGSCRIGLRRRLCWRAPWLTRFLRSRFTASEKRRNLRHVPGVVSLSHSRVSHARVSRRESQVTSRKSQVMSHDS